MTTVRMTGPFVALTAGAVQALPGELGVFELADHDGRARRVAYAGALEPFGIRSALAPFIGHYPLFRWECTSAYLTRWQELVMAHVADHGHLPPDQPEAPTSFGRLSPL